MRVLYCLQLVLHISRSIEELYQGFALKLRTAVKEAHFGEWFSNTDQNWHFRRR